mgnify:CR=1 FL=1
MLCPPDPSNPHGIAVLKLTCNIGVPAWSVPQTRCSTAIFSRCTAAAGTAVVLQGSYRTVHKGYEEVHVPALKPKPFAEGELAEGNGALGSVLIRWSALIRWSGLSFELLKLPKQHLQPYLCPC